MKPRFKYRKGVFLVVYAKAEGKIMYLLLHRILHWRGWEFPKGGIEKNETLKHAAARELKEETGLKPIKITNMHVKGKFNYPKALKDRPGIKGMEWKLYAVEISPIERTKIDRIEHSAYKWLSFKKAYKMLKFKDKRQCLKIVDKYIRGGFKKPQAYKIR